MALLFILLVIAGGMGLSVEAGLLGPLASQVGDRSVAPERCVAAWKAKVRRWRQCLMGLALEDGLAYQQGGAS